MKESSVKLALQDLSTLQVEAKEDEKVKPIQRHSLQMLRSKQLASPERVLRWHGTVFCKIASPMVHRALTWSHVGTFVIFCPLAGSCPPWSLMAQGCRSQRISCFDESICNDRLITIPNFFSANQASKSEIV